MKNEFKWASIMSIVLLIWLVALKYLGFQEGEKIGDYSLIASLYFVFLFGLFFLAVRERKHGRRNRGYITRRDAFLTGLITTFFIMVLSPIVMLVFHYLINPDFLSNQITYYAKHGMPIQEAENAYTVSGMVFNSLMMSMLAGGIFSAIIAFILENPPKKR